MEDRRVSPWPRTGVPRTKRAQQARLEVLETYALLPSSAPKEATLRWGDAWILGVMTKNVTLKAMGKALSEPQLD